MSSGYYIWVFGGGADVPLGTSCFIRSFSNTFNNVFQVKKGEYYRKLNIEISTPFDDSLLV